MANNNTPPETNSGSTTPPANVTPDSQDVVTQPELDGSTDTDIVDDKHNRDVTPTKTTRTVLSNPQQAKNILFQQADKARNPDKNPKSSKKSPTSDSKLTKPKLKRQSIAPIKLAGPKPLRKRQTSSIQTSMAAILPASPTRQTQGMPMYRSIEEASAAAILPPAPSLLPQTSPSLGARKPGTVGSVPRSKDPFASARKQKPKVNRRPNSAVKKDDPKAAEQKPLSVAEIMKTEDTIVKKPADAKAKLDIDKRESDKAKEDFDNKEETKNIRAVGKEQAELNSSKKKKEANSEPRKHKQESKPEDTISDIKSASRVPIGKQPSPPRLAEPKPLVAAVVTRKLPATTIVADKRKNTKAIPRISRKQTPKVGRNKR